MALEETQGTTAFLEAASEERPAPAGEPGDARARRRPGYPRSARRVGWALALLYAATLVFLLHWLRVEWRHGTGPFALRLPSLAGAPQAADLTFFTIPHCPACDSVKPLLRQVGREFPRVRQSWVDVTQPAGIALRERLYRRYRVPRDRQGHAPEVFLGRAYLQSPGEVLAGVRPAALSLASGRSSAPEEVALLPGDLAKALERVPRPTAAEALLAGAAQSLSLPGLPGLLLLLAFALYGLALHPARGWVLPAAFAEGCLTVLLLAGVAPGLDRLLRPASGALMPLYYPLSLAGACLLWRASRLGGGEESPARLSAATGLARWTGYGLGVLQREPVMRQLFPVALLKLQSLPGALAGVALYTLGAALPMLLVWAGLRWGGGAPVQRRALGVGCAALAALTLWQGVATYAGR